MQQDPQLVQLKAQLWDATQQNQFQQQLINTIVNELGFDGQVNPDDVIKKIQELMPKKKGKKDESIN